MSDESMNCTICCEKYTIQLRKPVTCQYCEFCACTVCIKKYLTAGLLDAHCMGCKRAWNDEFLDMNFTKAFRTGAYKKHREDILLDREVALLPTRQPRVEAKVKMNEVEAEMKLVHKELQEWDTKRQEILRKSSTLSRKLTRYSAESEGRPPPAWTLAEGEKAGTPDRAKFVMKCPDGECRGFLSTAYKCGTCQKWACPDCLVIKGKDKDAEHTCDPGVKETVALIIKESKACPKCGERISKIDGCFKAETPILMWNGTTKMSQDIIVGDELIGDDGNVRKVLETCTGEDEMFEISQSRAMNYTVNSKHKLSLKYRGNDSAQIQSFKDLSIDVYDMTVGEYLSLPISLQNDLYGYTTTGIESSISVKGVGKGNYYGWNVGDNHRFVLKDMTSCHNCDQMWCVDCHTAFSWTTGQLVNGVVHNPHYYEFLRKQGNGVAPRNAGDVPCGGVPYYHTLQQNIKHLDKPTQTMVMAIHRLTAEITEFRMQVYQGHFNVDDNGDLGVRYLMKDIEKDAMKSELVKRELKRNKHLAIRAVLEMFVNTSTMMLNNIVSHPPGDAAISEYNKAKAVAKDLTSSYVALKKRLEDMVAKQAETMSDPERKELEKEYSELISLQAGMGKELNKAREFRDGLEKDLQKTAMDEFAQVLVAYANLRTYVNDSLMGVSRMKNCSVPQISEEWVWKPFNKCAPKGRKKIVESEDEEAPAPAAPAPAAP